MTKNEALRMALEYLEESDNYLGSLDHSEPIAAIKEALTQPEPEPKFWEMPDGKIVDKWALQFYRGDTGTPLYTHPHHVDSNDTSQERVDKAGEKRHEPLTNEQITEIYTKWESTKGTNWADLMRAVEAAHGIKD